jgi:catechol 2,3-dioxygenase-like lactoylglutathione lyase family enzyme
MTTTTSAADSGSVSSLAGLKPRLLHVAYHVSDIDRAKAFYVGVLGLKEQMTIPLGNGLQEVILGFPDGPSAGVILMWNTQAGSARVLGDGYSRFVLQVSDVELAMERLAKHDTPVVTPITTAGPFKYAMVKDPDGYVIELLQMIR